MAYEIRCGDMMPGCEFVARGNTLEELMAQGAAHGKRDHGMTDEQLNDPQLQEKIKELVREV